MLMSRKKEYYISDKRKYPERKRRIQAWLDMFPKEIALLGRNYIVELKSEQKTGH